MEKYLNRIQAGETLAKELVGYANRQDSVILALPRGGVPVAYEIAKALHIPLDVFIVRKLGVPGYEELAMGAIAVGDTVILNHDIISEYGISSKEIDAVMQQEQDELKRREITYRGRRPFPALKNKTILLVDDGIATGATLRAAVTALRSFHPAAIIAAVPVADKTLSEQLAVLVDDFVCPLRPTQLNAVGAWYEDFSQTEDQEVRALLEQGRHIGEGS